MDAGDREVAEAVLERLRYTYYDYDRKDMTIIKELSLVIALLDERLQRLERACGVDVE